MTEHKSQLNPKVKKDFTETEVGALIEDIDHKLGSLVEGQTTLGGRMGRLEKRMEVLTDTVGGIKVELTVVNNKLDRKADRSQVTQLDRRVTVLEAK